MHTYDYCYNNNMCIYGKIGDEMKRYWVVSSKDAMAKWYCYDTFKNAKYLFAKTILGLDYYDIIDITEKEVPSGEKIFTENGWRLK